MKILGPQRYRLRFDSAKFSSECVNGTNKFSGISVLKAPKIYIFSTDNELLYVGATRRPMRERLRDGWKAAGKTGYYGYRLRHELETAELDVWLLQNASNNDANVDIETIEAEIVYLARSKGQWPRFQTEIHFHCSNKEHRDIAESIYGHYIKNSSAL